MKKYNVVITEYLRKDIEIEAVSEEAAEEIARTYYNRGDITLEYNDFEDVTFNVCEA